MSRTNSLLAALNRHWLMRGTATGAAVSGAALPLPPAQYSGVLRAR